MRKVSKCFHIGCVRLVRRPDPDVSAASRWLNSSWMYGSLVGRRGISAARPTRTMSPTSSIAGRRSCASVRKAFSSGRSHLSSNRGNPKASSPTTRSSANSTVVSGLTTKMSSRSRHFGHELDLACHRFERSNLNPNSLILVQRLPCVGKLRCYPVEHRASPGYVHVYSPPG